MFSFLKSKPIPPEKLCKSCQKNRARNHSSLCRSCIHYYYKKHEERVRLNPPDIHSQMFSSYAEKFLDPWQRPIVNAESEYTTEQMFKKGGTWERHVERMRQQDEATKTAVISLLNNPNRDIQFPIKMDDNTNSREFVKLLKIIYHIPYSHFNSWLIKEKYRKSNRVNYNVDEYIYYWMKDTTKESKTMNKILNTLWKTYGNEEEVKREYEKPSDCVICMESLENVDFSLDCGHWMHMDCIMKTEKPYCPLCRQKLSFENYQYRLKKMLYKD